MAPFFLPPVWPRTDDPAAARGSDYFRPQARNGPDTPPAAC